MKNILFVLLLIGSFCTLSFAQTNNTTLLHLDKSFYVTGEVMWYKFYLPTTLAAQESIVEVVISDRRGSILDQYYLQNNGKSYVEGYYKIPFNLDGDWYRISILSDDKNAPALLSTTFPIYNDLKVVAAESVASNAIQSAPSLADNFDIAIQLNKANYAPREQVEVSLSVKDKSGNPVKANVSVAVSDANLIDNDVKVQGTLTTPLDNVIAIGGTLIDDNGKGMRAGVLGMYSSLEDRIFYSSADTEGQFSFKPPLFYGKRPVQFIGYQFEHEEITVKIEDRKMAPISKELVYTDAVKTYMALSRQRKKVFQIYNSLESQLEPAKIELDIQELNPAFEYVIDEYESFEFMHDFFGELITPLKFVYQEDSTYIAELYNPTGKASKNTHLSGNPLFIIDGKLTRDANFVARMDMDYIEKVELMYKTENLRAKFRAIGRSGVVKITTNLKNVPMAKKDSEDIFTINGLQPKATFSVFQPNNIAARQPFFRPQLYWNSSLETASDGKGTFSFYQSDDVSKFVIRVVVQGENGTFGEASTTYEVRAKQ